MSNILVTGGCGFIGSHTCIMLLEKGHNLIILDNFSNGSPKSINKIFEIFEDNNQKVDRQVNLIKADLRNFSECFNVFKELNDNDINIDSVIHFGGFKDVKDSILKPLEYWENNVMGTINLLKVMDSFNCRSLVFSSSATIYNGNFKGKFKEDSPKGPINPYGFTKLNIERILNDLYVSSSSPWRIINLRYFNPVGAHHTGKIGENPLKNPSNLFPAITQAAIGKTKNLIVYGTDWPTRDGSAVRDFIHVMDLASAHIMALDYLLINQKEFISINLGSGKGTSVLELVDTFERVNDLKLPLIRSKKREGDFAELVADISLAKQILNWEPKKNIEDICKDGWKWQSLNPQGY